MTWWSNAWVELEFGVLVFVKGGKSDYLEKNPRHRDKNQQQTQPTCDAGSGNRTRATLVGGNCSHHCAIPTPLVVLTIWYSPQIGCQSLPLPLQNAIDLPVPIFILDGTHLIQGGVAIAYLSLLHAKESLRSWAILAWVHTFPIGGHLVTVPFKCNYWAVVG